jgi:signal transduction histidine kinase
MQMPTELTLKILFIEDSIDDFYLIKKILESDFAKLEAQRVDTEEEFKSALDTTSFDLIICDHNLPQLNSDEVLKYLKQKGIDIPMLLVTGALSDVKAVGSIRNGAVDYVLKSNLTKLPLVVKNILKQRETQRLKKSATKELARRNEELSKINRELDSFVYSVSHNLRSPLRSILGLLNLAMSENDFEQIREYHQMMHNSIQKLDGTLQDILDYSRNARQDVQIRQVNLRTIIEENFEKMTFMPGFERFSTEIEIDQDGDLYADHYRLSVIFNNLISNSIKYCDNNKPLQIIKIVSTISKTQAVIEFSDNGIGIESEVLSDIFKMFYRATDQADGSGLGLYIVKEAVDMLKGTISVNSALHIGTKFTITIPNMVSHAKQIQVNSVLVDKD